MEDESEYPHTAAEQAPKHTTVNREATACACKVALDGSKLIVRFDKTIKIVLDRYNKLLVGSDQLTIDHQTSKYIISSNSDKPQLAIIDACTNHRYHLIHVDMYGVVYTKEGCSHVIIGDVTQLKISNRAFPYKVCNKFVAPIASELLQNSRASTSHTASNEEGENTQTPQENDNQEKEWISKHFYKRLQRNEVRHTICLRGDESMTRIILSANEQLVLHAGKILAWTMGVSFTYGKSCCSKTVTGLQASKAAVVWVSNPYQLRPFGPPHK